MTGLHIEFIGVPGSGKTTLASNLVEELSGRGIDAATLSDIPSRLQPEDYRDRRISALLRLLPGSVRRKLAEPLYVRSADRFLGLRDFATEHPDLLGVVWRAVERRKKDELHPELVVGWFLDMIARFQVAKGWLTQGTTIVADEGFTNRVITLFGYGFGAEDRFDLRDYLAAIPRPDLVFHLDVQIEIAEERLRRAGRPASKRLAGEPARTNEVLMSGAKSCVEEAVALLRQSSVKVIDLPASDLRDSSSFIRQALEDHPGQ
jgi:thymidylate kinase